MHRIFIFILSIFFIICCVNPFAPGISDSDKIESGIVTGQKSPREVLTNFRYAYVFKDSLIYSDVLDSSFLFISKNYGTTPPTEIIWGRDVDIKTTMGLFRHFDALELNWGDTLSSTPNSIEITFQLTLDGGKEIPTIKGEAIFNFVQNADGMWRIERWEDLSSF
ncbi:MAG: hypothetical protein E4H13_04405 [Calditrichales bacterium]|nr:MAG: hypothetical protein E4H13_04405 [Calditrichales bacterium]